MFNVPLLQEQIDAAGIPNEGVGSDGTVYFLPSATQQQRDDAAVIVANHNPNDLTQQQEIDQAKTALSAIRQYLNQQLVKVSPATPADQVAAIKAIANGNTYLARIMTNQIAAMNGAFGWSLTNNPTTNPTRLQYIVTVELLTGVLPQF